MIVPFPLRIVAAVTEANYKGAIVAAAHLVDRRYRVTFLDTLQEFRAAFPIHSGCTDIVILEDTVLGGIPQICVEDMAEACQPAPLVIYTRQKDTAYAQAFRDVGCRGVLRFDLGVDQLVRFFRAVMSRRTAA